MATDAVSASLTIDAPCEAVFAILTDTSTHADVDGTGWVRGSAQDERIDAAGQVFRMAMYHPNHPEGHYETANLVVVFDAPTAVAWKTGTEDPDTGELSFGGWVWRYVLEPVSANRTAVTLTYDWSAVGADVRTYIEFPPFALEHLANSLQHIARLVARRGEGRA